MPPPIFRYRTPDYDYVARSLSNDEIAVEMEESVLGEVAVAVIERYSKSKRLCVRIGFPNYGDMLDSRELIAPDSKWKEV